MVLDMADGPRFLTTALQSTRSRRSPRMRPSVPGTMLDGAHLPALVTSAAQSATSRQAAAAAVILDQVVTVAEVVTTGVACAVASIPTMVAPT